MPESDRDKRQRKAQLAIQAIATSDETRDIRLAELARLRAFLDHTWREVSDEAGERDVA